MPQSAIVEDNFTPQLIHQINFHFNHNAAMNHLINTQHTINRSITYLLVVLSLGLFAFPAMAQVFDPGPSDPALFDVVVNVPPDPNVGPLHGSEGTQLNVFDGGVVDFGYRARTGSEINIIGGIVGEQFNAFDGSEINISGGIVGALFDANFDSVVNISGGSVGRHFDNFGGVVNISGGFIGPSFDAGSGEVNITGGFIEQDFEAFSGSKVRVSGGSLGRGFKAYPGSDVELFGGEFELNGIAYSGSTISLFEGDVFTGTLADGSTFNFSNDGSIDSFFDDRLSDASLTRVALPTLDLSPTVVATANPNRPSGLRPGQTLTLLNGGDLGDNFEAHRATLNVDGGNIGDRAGVANCTVNINGGTVGGYFEAYSGSVVNISGGSVGTDLRALSGSEVNISGGSVGENFGVFRGSVVNISGGTIGEGFGASGGINIIDGNLVPDFSNAAEINISGGIRSETAFFFGGVVVNISGGTWEDTFAGGFGTGSMINLFGSDFVLNGVSLDDSLTIGNAFTIEDRSGTLSGVFADGSLFSADLDSAFRSTGSASRTGTLTVTLGPPVTEIILGDCNQDDAVDFLDIAPFIAILTADSFLEQADCNEDGAVTFLDIAFFIAILAGT